jgi:hypothetical protein
MTDLRNCREDDDVNESEEHRDGEAKRKRTGGGRAAKK